MNKVLLFNPPLYFSEGEPRALDISVPPLGPLYLASYINKFFPRFDAEVIDIATEKYSLAQIGNIVREKNPLAIGVTSMTPQLQGAVELARFLKSGYLKKIPIFLGGPHISADPGFIKRHEKIFDYAITGEAEKTFAESIFKLSQSRAIPKVQVGEVIKDLDLIPFPDKLLIKREKYNSRESMMFSRGCPYHCYYCSRPSISRVIRYRSVSNLLEEINSVYENCQGKIDFQDDTFTMNETKVVEFCRAVIKNGLKLDWRCNTRIDLVSERLLNLMGRAGCSLIHFGIEAGNEKGRRETGNKGLFSNRQIFKVITWCHDNGVRFAGYFMIGHPGESKTELEETKKMILTSGIDVVGLSIPTPFPGSVLYEKAKESGIINEKIIDKFAEKEYGEGYVGNYPVYTSEKVNREDVYGLMKEINRRFYLTPKMFARKFFEDMVSPSRLKNDFSDLLSIISKGMSSRKPYTDRADKTKIVKNPKKKIVFVVVGVESLAVEFLSSFLKKYGYEVELVFDPRLFNSEAIKVPLLAKTFDVKRELAKEIISKKPDLIGFSVFTLNYRRCLELAREVKKLDKKTAVIFGGIHPTSVPETVLKESCVDMVCVGEGEDALKELLENIESGKNKKDIKNIWFKSGRKIYRNACRPLIDDLDKVPFPDKDLFHHVYSQFVTDDYFALSSRGCPFACTYCGNNVLRRVYKGLGKSIRQRSPKNICDELEIAIAKYHPRQITFADDVFVQDIKWLRDFTKEYRQRINLPYVMLTHPRFVNYQIAKLLANSGCFLLMFGLQSASEKTRFNVLKRFETNKEVEKAATGCHKAGLNFSIDHIFNIPTEGIREYEEAINFYNKLRPSIINAYWLQYFPGTQIIQTANKEGIIKKSMVKEINEGRTSTSLVVGFGGKDNFSPELIYRNFQFLFMLLPLLPKRVMDFIIQKKFYLKVFNPPIIVNIGLKFLVNLKNKRAGVYFGIIRSIIYFSKSNLLLKWKYR